ncbi:MAG: transaldolase family protein [Gammaproteobacteria bacterium]|jgi:transaldolase/glucose-6-phosphate isomerase
MHANTRKRPNSLQQLGKKGQSVRLNYIRRSLITSGALDRLIEQDGLHGMTSNPAIFIANARIACKQHQSIFSGKRWRRLARAGAGARHQRLLRASTGTRNPAYRDVHYVGELTGRVTVSTLPPATLDAFRDHGRVRESLTESVEESARLLALPADQGIVLDTVTGQLLDEAVAAFAEACDRTLSTIHKHLSVSHGTVPH